MQSTLKRLQSYPYGCLAWSVSQVCTKSFIHLTFINCCLVLKEIILAWVCMKKSFFKNDLPFIFTGCMGKHYFHSINVTLDHMDSLTSKLFFHVVLKWRQYVDLPSHHHDLFLLSPIQRCGIVIRKATVCVCKEENKKNNPKTCPFNPH